MEYVPELFYFPNHLLHLFPLWHISLYNGEKAVLTLLTDPYTNTGKLKVEGAATADDEY